MIYAATGHRPHLLGGYGHNVREKLLEVSSFALRSYNPSFIISGMALGWDTAIALSALKLKIPLICAIPFEGQSARWSQSDREVYNHIRNHAHEVVVVSDVYNRRVFFDRDEYMVNRADKILALYDFDTNPGGGTAHTIEYAKSMGKPVFNFWELWRE